MPGDVDSSIELVLLPGLDGTGELFAPLCGELPASIRPHVVAYSTDTSATLAEYVEHVVARLPDGPFVLLAESFSGLVALALLPRVANRLRGVVFCGAFGRPPRPWLLRLAGWVPPLGSALHASPRVALRLGLLDRGAPDDVVRAVRDAIRRVSAEVLAERVALIAAADASVPAACDIPCLYLQGGRDRVVPASAASWFASRFDRFELRMIDGPHLLLQTRPKACADALVSFVNSLD